jgi:hypothetical protein
MCATCGCGKKGPMKKAAKKAMPFEKKEAKGGKEKGESKKAEAFEKMKAKKKK